MPAAPHGQSQLHRLAEATGIKAVKDTRHSVLLSYTKNGKSGREPGPDHRDRIFKAVAPPVWAGGLGGGVPVDPERPDGTEKNGIRIACYRLPELETPWKLPKGWVGGLRPHEAPYDGRYDFEGQPPDGIAAWNDFVRDGLVADSVAVFPRFDRWSRIIDFKPPGKFHNLFAGEYVVVRIVRTGSIGLAVQRSFHTKAKGDREFWIVPGWGWDPDPIPARPRECTPEDRSSATERGWHGADWEHVELLRSGNLRITNA
jgi:hypothetical protein